MEAGYRTAGDGDEQSREQAAVTYLKTVKCIQLHIGMSHDHTKYGTDDHTQQHKGGHVISGLHQSHMGITDARNRYAMMMYIHAVLEA